MRFVDKSNQTKAYSVVSIVGKSVSNKHYILSTGELLVTNIDIKDVRRRYRCQVANRVTGERIDSSNWARIVLTGKPCLYPFPQKSEESQTSLKIETKFLTQNN